MVQILSVSGLWHYYQIAGHDKNPSFSFHSTLPVSCLFTYNFSFFLPSQYSKSDPTYEVVKDPVTAPSGSTVTDIHTTSDRQSQPFGSSSVVMRENPFTESGDVDPTHLESGTITQTPRSACQLNARLTCVLYSS